MVAPPPLWMWVPPVDVSPVRSVASFVRYEGITVEIHQPDDEGNPKLVWCEHGLGDGGAWRGGPVRLLRTGQHYDLLLPNVPS